MYSSIVLAILLSTVIAPFSLRFTIHYFEKKTFQEIEDAEELEKVRQETGNSEEQLKVRFVSKKMIIKQTIVSLLAN